MKRTKQIQWNISYCRIVKSKLPEEIIYVDDTTDFISNNEIRKKVIIEMVNRVFPSKNLKVNKEKTEHTIPIRGDRNTETWRSVKKVGSLLEDSEDIIRRKQLALASMNKLERVWIKRDHVSELKRLRMYNSLVLPALLYNCATWGLSKKEEKILDSFHRTQLRHIFGKKYPHIISNFNLYKRCQSYPISFCILRVR